MELDLDNHHPLAVAIRDAVLGDDVWVLVKSPGKPTHFRAVVSKWEFGADETHIVFDTWETHMERKAQLAGL